MNDSDLVTLTKIGEFFYSFLVRKEVSFFDKEFTSNIFCGESLEMLPASSAVKRPSSFSIESLMSRKDSTGSGGPGELRPLAAKRSLLRPDELFPENPVPPSQSSSSSSASFKSAVHQLQEHCSAINRRQSSGLTTASSSAVAAPEASRRSPSSPLSTTDRHSNPGSAARAPHEPPVFHPDFIRPHRPDASGSYHHHHHLNHVGSGNNLFGGILPSSRPLMFQGQLLQEVHLMQQNLLRLPGLMGGHHPYLQGHPHMFSMGGRSPVNQQEDANTFYAWLLSRNGPYFNHRLHPGS